tara:strand:- start:1442 stop:1678 length:237 start_codon:yes stop_codon:yes gene_type:complete
MLTQEQRVLNAKDIARVVICSFSTKENVKKWLDAYKGANLNEYDELDLIAIHVKRQLTDPNFNLSEYKKLHKRKRKRR